MVSDIPAWDGKMANLFYSAMTPAIIFADVVVTGDETVGQISICLHLSGSGATTVNTDKENNRPFEIHKSCANSDTNLCILILLFIDVNQR